MTAVVRAGTQPSQKGPAEYFTGTVRIDPLFQPTDSTQASGAYVTFEPGARTAWHTHPRGQTLIVTAAMTHLAIQEHLSGKVVQWMEKVTDEQYAATPSR